MSDVTTIAIPSIAVFHIRAIWYGHNIRSEEFDTFDEALDEALDHFWGGHSAHQEIWCGDDCVMDHTAFFQACIDDATEKKLCG